MIETTAAQSEPRLTPPYPVARPSLDELVAAAAAAAANRDPVVERVLDHAGDVPVAAFNSCI